VNGDGDVEPKGAIPPPKGPDKADLKTPTPPDPVRLVQGSVVGGVGAAQLRRGDKTRIGDILVKNGDISQETLDKALGIQEERGGQLGRIFVTMGACSEAAIARALLAQIKLRRKQGGTDASLAARENPDVAGGRQQIQNAADRGGLPHPVRPDETEHLTRPLEAAGGR